MISAIGIRHYVATMGGKGFSPDVVLAGSGIDCLKLADPSCLVTYAQYRAVVNNVIRLAGDDGIGFDMAKVPDLANFGVYGHTMSTCRTMRDTHHLWIRFGASLVGIDGKLDIVSEDSRSVTLAMVDPSPSDPFLHFYVEETLGLLLNFGQLLVGEPPAFLEMTLSYPEPPYVQRYRDLFQCRMRFAAKRSSIRIPRNWLDLPVRTRDEEFNSVCLKHCEYVLSRIAGVKPTTSALQNFFARHADHPPPDLDAAALLLKLTPRTLRRRLREEGTTYREQIDAYRAELAKKFLACGTVMPKEVAFLLGFKEQSSFRHAFKTWTGQTVGEYRAQAALPS